MYLTILSNGGNFASCICHNRCEFAFLQWRKEEKNQQLSPKRSVIESFEHNPDLEFCWQKTRILEVKLKDNLVFSRHLQTCGHDRRDIRWMARVLWKLWSTRPFSLPVDLLAIAVQGCLRQILIEMCSGQANLQCLQQQQQQQQLYLYPTYYNSNK